jgi:hypothetical protein
MNAPTGFREVVKHAFLLEVFDERRSGSTRRGSGQALAHLHTVPGSIDSRGKNPAQASGAGHPVPGGRVAGVAPSVSRSGRERSDPRWDSCPLYGSECDTRSGGAATLYGGRTLIRRTVPLRIDGMRTPFRPSEGSSCLRCHRAIERVEEHTYFVEATRTFICPYCRGEQELPDSTPR